MDKEHSLVKTHIGDKFSSLGSSYVELSVLESDTIHNGEFKVSTVSVDSTVSNSKMVSFKEALKEYNSEVDKQLEQIFKKFK